MGVGKCLIKHVQKEFVLFVQGFHLQNPENAFLTALIQPRSKFRGLESLPNLWLSVSMWSALRDLPDLGMIDMSFQQLRVVLDLHCDSDPTLLFTFDASCAFLFDEFQYRYTDKSQDPQFWFSYALITTRHSGQRLLILHNYIIQALHMRSNASSKVFEVLGIFHIKWSFKLPSLRPCFYL